MKTSIRCVGVAEHFNYPWMMGLEKGQFEKVGIDLKWEDSDGGTGAMCKDLRVGKADLAVMLTEGAIKDILDGNPSKIVSSYVNSPLIWGVHTSASSTIVRKENIQYLPFVISRFNSGSHLMGKLHAEKYGVTLTDDDFIEVGGLDNAIEHLQNNPNHLFLWEKFTTKPFVDNGTLKLLDECPTPWPSFIIVVRNEYLENNFEVVEQVLEIVRKNCEALKASVETPFLIAERYGIKYEDAVAWFNALEWNVSFDLKKIQLKKVMDTLQELDILDAPSSNYKSHLLFDFKEKLSGQVIE